MQERGLLAGCALQQRVERVDIRLHPAGLHLLPRLAHRHRVAARDSLRTPGTMAQLTPPPTPMYRVLLTASTHCLWGAAQCNQPQLRGDFIQRHKDIKRMAQRALCI